MQETSNKPMQLAMAPRCLAKTRSGKACQSPAVNGKKRCRMHGGAKGSGAPSGPANGNYRHGGQTKEALAERRLASGWLAVMRRQAASL